MNKKQIMDPKNRNDAIAKTRRVNPRRRGLIWRWIYRADVPLWSLARRARAFDAQTRRMLNDQALRGERRPGPPKPERYISIGYDLAPSGRRSCAE